MSPGAEILEEQEVTKEMAESLQEDIVLPYTVEDVTLISPGHWNGVDWTAEEIKKGLSNTEFENAQDNEGEIEQNNALFFEHDDRDARAWIGEVKNIRMDGNELVGDLVVVDEEAATKLEYGAKFGISAKITGRTDGDVMKNMRYENFSLVLNPAVKTTFINSEMAEMIMQEMEIHEPEFDDTADQEWNSPDMEDFDTDDLSEIGNHFIVSKTGFPAENFTDLALPVVEPDGTLNLNALANAKARAGQVTGLEGDKLSRVENIINMLAEDNFPESDFEGSGHMPEEDDEEMEEDENDNLNDTMGENTTMTEEDQPEQESGEELEEAEAESVDVESLKEQILEELQSELEEDEGDEEVEDEGGDAEVEEAEEDLSEFEEFVRERKSENPDLSYKELAEEFEESNKSADEKVEERVAEVKQEMASQIEDLKEQVSELSESEAEPARASKASGEEVKELTEKVKEQDRDELRKGVMRTMLDQAQASQLYK